MTEAEKAAEVLGEPEDQASSEPPESGGSEQQPDGVNRLFRTDRALDMDEKVPFWNPEEGGIERIGAALKQMGGWEYIPPAVWLMLGMLEAFYSIATSYVFAENDTTEQPDENDDTEEPEVEVSVS